MQNAFLKIHFTSSFFFVASGSENFSSWQGFESGRGLKGWGGLKEEVHSKHALKKGRASRGLFLEERTPRGIGRVGNSLCEEENARIRSHKQTYRANVQLSIG